MWASLCSPWIEARYPSPPERGGLSTSSRWGVARVGDADVELGPGEVVFVPTNDYHGFENTGDEPVFMIWGYAGAANLDEAGYIRYVDDHPA